MRRPYAAPPAMDPAREIAFAAWGEAGRDDLQARAGWQSGTTPRKLRNHLRSGPTRLRCQKRRQDKVVGSVQPIRWFHRNAARHLGCRRKL